MAAFFIHEFRCMNCGKPGIPLARKQSHLHGRLHRKKLYCPHCKAEVNHIEIKSEDDLQEFLENWEAGEYYDEAQESMAHCGSAGRR